MSKTTGFTPGPWKVGQGKKHICIARAVHVDSGNAEHPICLISPIKLLSDEDLANARLIAAAPSMYELLEEVVQSGGILRFGDIDRIKSLLQSITHA